jgi:hypothetical protein
MKRGGFLKRRTPLRRTALKRSPTAPRRPVARRKAPKRTTITKLKKKLWELCKALTRLKYGNTCYTSGKTGLVGSDWHTGHYIHSSLCSVELRYDLKNLRPQSYDQNINKNGNTLEYRRRLIRDHGVEYVEELEQRNQATKGKQYDSLWYLAKIEEYTALLSNLKV